MLEPNFWEHCTGFPAKKYGQWRTMGFWEEKEWSKKREKEGVTESNEILED